MNKTAITIGSILGLGVIGYFVWKKFGKKSTTAPAGNQTKSAVATAEEVVEGGEGVGRVGEFRGIEM